MPNASLTIDGTEVIKKENGVVSLKNTNADTSLSFPANHAGIKAALNASGDAPIYACRAWVNFDGTNAFSPNPSTSAIRDSGNVSTVADNGTGDYTVNFETAMPDNDYVVAACGRHWNGVSDYGYNVCIQTTDGDTNVTPSSVRITTHQSNTSLQDSPVVSVAIFR